METKSKIAVGVKNLKLTMPEGTDPYTNIRASLLSRNGNIWFATTGEGVYRFDRQIFTNFTTKDGLADNVVYRIYEGSNGNIWFETNK